MAASETDRRRAKFAQIEREWVRWSGGRPEEPAPVPSAAELVALLDELGERPSLDRLRGTLLLEWPRRAGYVLNQGRLLHLRELVHGVSENLDALEPLIRALRMPRSEAEVRAKVGGLLSALPQLRQPGRTPLVLSNFWHLQGPEDWPVLWADAEEGFKELAWLESINDPAERYIAYRQVVLDSRPGPRSDPAAIGWFHNERPFCGLDPSLIDRCAENAELLAAWLENSAYRTPEEEVVAERNAVALRSEMALLTRALQRDVEERIGRTVRRGNMSTQTSTGGNRPFRADGFASFVLGGGGVDRNSASLRVWVTRSGVAVLVHPGWGRADWFKWFGSMAAPQLPAGMEFLRVLPHESLNRIEPVGTSIPFGEFAVGRWFPGRAALDGGDFVDSFDAALVALKPIVDSVAREVLGEPVTPAVNDSLTSLVREFKEQRPYPTEKDLWSKAERDNMASGLSHDALQSSDVATLRRAINSGAYGSPGPQSRLNTTLRDADEPTLERILRNLDYLLWGPDDDVRRIDRLLDPDDLGVHGLGEAVTMKLLAICHPERWVPVYPYRGEWGKVTMLRLLGLEPPGTEGKSTGQLHGEANDMLRERLGVHFPDDPWAMSRFLYWYQARPIAPTDIDPIPALADELLLDRTFLDDVVSLLREKGQVIFYGPPGTGKTYVAKRLAAALAPDPSRRMIVQFHPSTSYEDFFEGYRPAATGDDGALRYELKPGPLALLAERASTATGYEHVMVIDEINRGNLPRILGELLFLLEYRDEAVRTLYRPDEAFELPRNLLFVGTMNTADRSIALVDAALRRRFHFVPFFPHEGPLADLLRRWLSCEGEPEWPADLLDMVNGELRERLGGPHLQVGPSHLMKTGLDESSLRRIWDYSVFPFIEEQLYGDWAGVEQFRFDAVLRRYRKGVEDLPEVTLPEAPGGIAIPDA
jgi:5-methylcytosine-specific restriction protein B